MEPGYFLVLAIPGYLLARVNTGVLLYLFYGEIERPLAVDVFEHLLIAHCVQRVMFL